MKSIIAWAIVVLIFTTEKCVVSDRGDGEVGGKVGNGEDVGRGVCAGGEEGCRGQDGDALKIRAFESWIQENNLPVNFLKVERMPIFRMGTTATEDLRGGQLYIAVPDKLLIGPERVGPGSKLQGILSDIAAKHGDFGGLVDDRVKLIMFLLREANPKRKKASFWQPYIDLLPPNLSNPFLWSDSDLAYLEASEVAAAAKAEKRKLRAEYDQLRSKVFAHNRKAFPKEAFSLQRWFWGCALYDSRVIQLNRQKGQGNTPTWIPLIDMVNCIESHDRTFIKYDAGLKAAVMYADRQTPRGTQVFETYGNKSNYEYLLYNGFVMKDNPNDCVYVALPHPSGAGAHRRQQQACLGSTAVPRLAQQWAQRSSEAEQQAPQKNGVKASDGSRARARGALIALVRDRLSSYSSSSRQQDEALLADLANDMPAAANKVLAVQMRMHEKSTLMLLLQGLENGSIDCC